MDKTKLCLLNSLRWKIISCLSPFKVNQFGTWDFVRVDTLEVPAL